MSEQKKRLGRPPSGPKPPTDVVKRVRFALRLTQGQFAEQLNCSLSSVERYERTRSAPELGALKAQLKKLARRAGIPLDVPPAAHLSARPVASSDAPSAPSTTGWPVGWGTDRGKG